MTLHQLLIYAFMVSLALQFFSMVSFSVKRSIAFEDIQRQKTIYSSSPLLVERTTSKTSCILKCLFHTDCISISFCDDRVCMLNLVDIYSKTSELEHSKSCIYQGMRREESPDCTTEDDPEKCEVEGKKQDGEWTQWVHSVQVDTPHEWKKSRVRDCHPPSHGGAPTCVTREEDVLEWVFFVRERKNWTDAAKTCENMNGHLFDSLNGTEEQLLFFVEKFNTDNYWVGIWTLPDSNQKGWKNMKGEVVSHDILLWNEGQPDNDRGRDTYASMTGSRLSDQSYFHSRSILCEMI